MVNVLVEYFRTFYQNDEMLVVDRPLRPVDPNRAIGVSANTWAPVENTHEIGQHIGPTLTRYTFRIQNMAKGTQEGAGQVYSVDAKAIRSMLAFDETLHIQLRELTDKVFGVTERVKRLGVTNQRFLNNEFRGTFLFLATTELWIETESVLTG